MRKINKPKKKYQKGGEQRAKDKLPSAPVEYRDMVHQMGRDTTGMTMSPFGRQIDAKRHMVNTNFQGNDAFYNEMPVQDFVKHIGDPIEGPQSSGYNPMRRSSMEHLYNLPPTPESMQEAQDSLQNYRVRQPWEEFQYGGTYGMNPRLAPPQMPNMPDANKGGNILSGAMSGASMGSAFGAPGAIVGGALGLVGGLFKNRSANKAQDAAMDQYQEQLGGFQNQLLGQNYMTQHNIPTFRRGGQMQGGFEDELMSGMPTAEVENNEMVQSPMGEMATMDGATHAQGGIDVAMDPGDRVYSDELKDEDGKTFAEKADKLRKSNEKYQKVLDDPRATKLAKFTANKMLQKISGNLDGLFQKQEAMKAPTQPAEGPIDAQPQFKEGGELLPIDLPLPILDSGFTPPTGLANMNTRNNPRFNPNARDSALGGDGYSWGNLLGDAATFAPATYNLFKGAVGTTPDIQFDPNQYSGYQEVTPRRVSLDPIRRDIEGRERAANRAISQMGADTTGATYSRMAANAADTKRAMGNAAMTEEQAYSQADMQAQMANQQAALNSNQLGMQGALRYEDMRQRAMAVPTAHLTSGLTQMSDIVQSRRLMENQRARDVQRGHALDGYSQLFGYGNDGMGFGTQTDSRMLNERSRGSGWLGNRARNPLRRNR